MGASSTQEKVLTSVYPTTSVPTHALDPTYLLTNNFRCHVGHESDGELANHFPGDHSLGP